MNATIDYVPAVLIALTILLPILPAILIFKLLPSAQAAAQGPFQKLQIKLSGAFAAYFVVLLATSLLTRPTIADRVAAWNRYVSSIEKQNEIEEREGCTHYHSWTVDGTIELDPPDPAFPIPAIRCYIRPPNLNPLANGQIQFEIPIKRMQDGKEEPVTLMFEYENYSAAGVHLLDRTSKLVESARVKTPSIDWVNRRIELNEPIVMRRRPDAAVQGTPARAVPVTPPPMP